MADNEKNLSDRIKELEAQLKAVEDTHVFQAKRGDDLEAQLRDAQGRHEFQRKRADRAEAKLKSQPAAASSKDCVLLDGAAYDIIGTFRADNTFVEVKRGHCDEGTTLVAIKKVF